MATKLSSELKSLSFLTIRTKIFFGDPNKVEFHTRCIWRVGHHSGRTMQGKSALLCIEEKESEIDENVRDTLTKLLTLRGIEHIVVYRYHITVFKGGAFNWHPFNKEDPTDIALQPEVLAELKELESKYT